MQIRTRFAPSPTGYLHIGGLRSALYAYLFAKKNKGTFILRIEDTDQDRYVDGAIDVIYNTLHETGLNWDEGPDIGGSYGPYIQTERRELYTQHAWELVERGGAYPCFCTKEALDARRKEVEASGGTFKYDKHCLHLSKEEAKKRIDAGEPFVLRQNIPAEGQTTFSDLVFGDITVDNDTLDDNVILKADGLPTYNFANVVDDHCMEISHVMRGTEYLSSTPKYNLLYESFGWEIPKYIHMSPVMRDAQHKLSKRDGDASYDDFIQKGYLKEAIVNYIALLGWNPGTEQEKFSLDELIEAFSLEGLSKSPAIFDPAKMKWLNFEYIRALSPEDYRLHAFPWYEKAGLTGWNYDILGRILQPRTEIFSQIPEMTDFLTEFPSFSPDLYFHKKMKTDAELAKEILPEVLTLLEGLAEWDETPLHDALMNFVQETGRKNGQVLWPFRIAIAGKAVTPGGAIEIATLLGREETLRRLRLSMEQLENE